MSCTRLAENTGRKIRRLRTIVQLCRTISSQLRHVSSRQSNKKLVKQQYLIHMSSQYGELRPTNRWDQWRVWGTPTNFNWFLVVASLFSRFDQQHSTEDARYIRLGGHHVRHRPTFCSIHMPNVQRDMITRTTKQNFAVIISVNSCLQCFDAVGWWASSRASGL